MGKNVYFRALPESPNLFLRTSKTFFFVYDWKISDDDKNGCNNNYDDDDEKIATLGTMITIILGYFCKMNLIVWFCNGR